MAWERREQYCDAIFRSRPGGNCENGASAVETENEDNQHPMDDDEACSLFPCHRVFLRTRSPFFRRALRLRWKNSRRIRVNDTVSGRAFGAVLQYLYTGRLEGRRSLCCDLLPGESRFA
jgi:hypothetical protein